MTVHAKLARSSSRVVGAVALASVLVAMSATHVGAQDPTEPVRAVPVLDLARYAGRWYEVARFPGWFERRCVGQGTADYELQPDSTIKIVNTCRTADSTINRAEGAARLADRGGPASKLKVRFAPGFLSFLPMVWADYWVLDLKGDYRAAGVLAGRHPARASNSSLRSHRSRATPSSSSLNATGIGLRLL